jgi:CysZ protein
MRAFFDGAVYPFRALGVLNRTPQLWGYVILPIVLNVIVGAALYAAVLVAGLEAIRRAVAGLPEWAAALGFVLQALLVVGLLVAIGFVLVRFGVVLGSPFYGTLSERLELLKTGEAPPARPLTPLGIARDISRALAFELKKLLLVALVSLPLLLLNAIPVIGTIVAAGGWIVVGVLIACLDFFDPALERRQLRFRRKLGVVRRGLPGTAGFGLVCFGLVSIPLINLLAIPLCITAGTLFFIERLRGLPELTEM